MSERSVQLLVAIDGGDEGQFDPEPLLAELTTEEIEDGNHLGVAIDPDDPYDTGVWQREGEVAAE